MPKRKPDDIVGLRLRFTEAMRARLEQEAKKNHRSLNSEIVYRLGTTFGAEGIEFAGEFEEAEKDMQRVLHEIVREIRANAPKLARRRG
jgi:hypothetical protein